MTNSDIYNRLNFAPAVKDIYVPAVNSLISHIDPILLRSINQDAKPGAGKGDQCALNSIWFNSQTYSASGGLRSYVDEVIRTQDPKLADRITSQMENCAYVEDRHVLGSFERELPKLLNQLENNGNIQFDGITRTKHQATEIARLLSNSRLRFSFSTTVRMDIPDYVAEFRQLTRGLHTLYSGGIDKVRLDSFDPSTRLREYNPKSKVLLEELTKHSGKIVLTQGEAHPAAVSYSIIYQLANPNKTFDDARNTKTYQKLASFSVAPIDVLTDLAHKIETRTLPHLKSEGPKDRYRSAFFAHGFLKLLATNLVDANPQLREKPQ